MDTNKGPNERENRSINAVPVSTIRMGAIVYYSSKFFQIPSVSRSVPSSDDVLVYTQMYKDGQLAELTDNAQLYITYYHLTPRAQNANEVRRRRGNRRTGGDRLNILLGFCSRQTLLFRAKCSNDISQYSAFANFRHFCDIRHSTHQISSKWDNTCRDKFNKIVKGR